MRKPGLCVVLIDWHFVGSSTPAVVITWYLWSCGIRLPVASETTIAWYRDRMAHRLGSHVDEAQWQPQMELSLLGQMLRCGQDMAWAAVRHKSAAVRAWAREALAWWSEQANLGARHL